jgi:alcohol dehydrogenase class IV
MSFHLRLPRRVIFGVGVYAQLGPVARGLGRRALLVTGRAALRRSGRLQQAEDMLREQGVDCILVEGVENDPSLKTCAHAIHTARRERCDFVLSIGGGSALDAGKTAAAVAPQAGELPEYFDGPRKLEKPPLPQLAVPTTAGTGSESTPNAVLSDTDRGVKKSLRDERMVPDAALVDPELTVPLPPEITAHAGMDALAQAVECFVSRDANPYSDALALRAIDLVARHLPGAVADGADMAHREPVALASLLTGIAFGNAGLGAVHGFANPLGAALHAPHGLICAVLLPPVCEFNLPAAERKFGEIAHVLGARSGHDVPAALAALNHRLGIPATLRAQGLTRDQLPALVAASRSGSMNKNPRPPTDEDLAGLLARVL